MIKQEIVYEWLPPKCTNCDSFGHGFSACQFTKIWVPKGKVHSNFQKIDMVVDESTHMQTDQNGTNNGKDSNKDGNSTNDEVMRTVNEDSLRDADELQVMQDTNEPQEDIYDAVNNSHRQNINEVQTQARFIHIDHSLTRKLGPTNKNLQCNKSGEDITTCSPNPNMGPSESAAPIPQVEQLKNSRNEVQNLNAKCATRSISVHKKCSDESPFEFRAEVMPDVIANPAWNNLVMNIKEKRKKSKKSKANGVATAPEISNNTKQV